MEPGAADSQGDDWISTYEEACRVEELPAIETEPFKQKYCARDKFRALLNSISDKISDNKTYAEQKVWLRKLQAALHYKLAVNFLVTEETGGADEHLVTAKTFLEEDKLCPKTVGVLAKVLNQKGILESTHRNYVASLEALNESETLYKDFWQKASKDSVPYFIEDLFAEPDDTVSLSDNFLRSHRLEFERTHTLTLFYLAQVHGLLENTESSAEYCKATLVRQLNSNEYEPEDWALNAVTMSQYYTNKHEYSLARHCLACAELIYKEAAESEKEKNDGEDDKVLSDTVQHLRAHINRCWVKYGLSLLGSQEFEDRGHAETADAAKQADDDPPRQGSIAGNEIHNEKFNLEVSEFETAVIDTPPKSYSEAREIFLSIQKWLTTSMEYLTLNEHCTDHVEVIQDYSTLFKLLASFESDLGRQCKMHKRRVDLLSNVLKRLNAKHYMSICRQLMFELGETYSVMVDLKFSMLESSPTQAPSNSAAKKLNSLIAESIGYFEKYLKTLRTGESFPESFQEEDTRPALLAQFYIGRLHSKVVECNPRARMFRLQQTLEKYEFIADYCRRNPDAAAMVHAELHICQEMIDLLPRRMNMLRTESEA